MVFALIEQTEKMYHDYFYSNTHENPKPIANDTGLSDATAANNDNSNDVHNDDVVHRGIPMKIKLAVDECVLKYNDLFSKIERLFQDHMNLNKIYSILTEATKPIISMANNLYAIDINRTDIRYVQTYTYTTQEKILDSLAALVKLSNWNYFQFIADKNHNPNNKNYKNSGDDEYDTKYDVPSTSDFADEIARIIFTYGASYQFWILPPVSEKYKQTCFVGKNDSDSKKDAYDEKSELRMSNSTTSVDICAQYTLRLHDYGVFDKFSTVFTAYTILPTYRGRYEFSVKVITKTPELYIGIVDACDAINKRIEAHKMLIGFEDLHAGYCYGFGNKGLYHGSKDTSPFSCGHNDKYSTISAEEGDICNVYVEIPYSIANRNGVDSQSIGLLSFGINNNPLGEKIKIEIKKCGIKFAISNGFENAQIEVVCSRWNQQNMLQLIPER